MAPSTFEDDFQAAVENKVIPGAVLVATNTSGTLNYAKAFGSTGVSPDAQPLTLDSTFWLASCTKLMATVAALQCVERGLFSLDSPEDVARLLPEFKTPDIVTSELAEHGRTTTKLHPAKNGITLRQLLTHTCGMANDFGNPALLAWRHSRGEEGCHFEVDISKLQAPLVFEPGEGWDYSTGLDWAGQMVERANGGILLETYMQENVWGPLGMRSTTFHLERNESVRTRLAGLSERVPETGLLVPAPAIMADPARDATGGAGAYASAPDYLQVLTSILRDDGTLLKSATVAEMFTQQLQTTTDAIPGSQDAWMDKLRSGNISVGIDPTPADITWGIGGTLLLEDLDGRRQKGTLAWWGYPNLFWWIDRKAGVTGFYAGQVLPARDAKSMELFARFEKEIYQRAKALK
ncbi:beta-lactamase [Athelia psychrophila]|uniref:Beta-lactamase n=1 Tax=Athelia psychrophila TaxID=1759441 RepID=A0A166KXT9_9AGAM|nr:beta-lactamase [Fibularhizoctonia sp. CBS 109695]